MIEENFQRILDQIKNNPETFTSDNWHDGEKHNFIGWAQVFQRGKPDRKNLFLDCCSFLGSVNFQYLSDPNNTLLDFEFYLKNNGVYDSKGYNSKGFSQLGFDKDGYDLEGFKNGWDRKGYSRSGSFNKSRVFTLK
jgi:hypothetical protein